MTALGQQVTVFATFVATVGLVLARPTLGGNRLSPAVAACAGVLVILAAGALQPADIAEAGRTLLRPLLAIGAIMVLSEATRRFGVLDWLASAAEQDSGASAHRLFRRIFILAAASSAVLNNDTTIIICTPLVIALVQRRYPGRPDLVVPFAFAVFMAAGVAPFMVSNPMNMVVAEAAGIRFNQYALQMAPIAAASWVVSYIVLHFLFRERLDTAPLPAPLDTPWTPRQGHAAMLALLFVVLAAYPVTAYLGGPVWLVACTGAGAACLLAWQRGVASPVRLVHRGVPWETLLFLLAVYLLGAGLRNVGVVAMIAELYEGASLYFIGVCAALGSAVMNNHPTAILNYMALGGPAADSRAIFAALIGGDLGPRLLPMGSLAGLMWIAVLERAGVHVTVRTFFRVGALVLIPTLAVTLAMLTLM